MADEIQPPRQIEVRESTALEIANEQANDDGLWFDAVTAPEAYLQQALRVLHAAVEAGAAQARRDAEELAELRALLDGDPQHACPACGLMHCSEDTKVRKASLHTLEKL